MEHRQAGGAGDAWVMQVQSAIESLCRGDNDLQFTC